MSYDTPINESVSVWAFFDPSADTTLSTHSINSVQADSGQARIFPIAISWRRRLIKFQKLIFTNTKRVGGVKLIDLVCASENSNFELEYNSDNHLWKLKRVMPRE
ncbi:hypothetical protein A2870_00500 [Candidatus Curtissbacteria bacterium RIFCSPHIGHO2_01_FULL_41_11]|uniref:Uncharacterized protein n=1 Tax=Candidatus Curtissbacteria bacterium RIFCSPHIGHO2_01_FULL_41_11 TaxID=1797711 RepID=A0A1F5G8A1_9BACT|nr:MAG: hypothetical protein A2870_00500 [Candidatus Curtissbacteria bacterium RIFCSPHIGHO2_01_FULL_41_11]